ncbi:conserved hypothetical protein [Chlorobium phaeobacteroides DSM 266]|uniref:Transcriptional regulator n=2 Tax=Chlorobium phaeobacteroides TaxID=1096 RepID=A1BI28_CHLPD|nr:conserved hypothetical protein [Chlorobium phaeobacteroides DSM 266]
MDLGLFKTVVTESGLDGKPIFLLCDLEFINEISYSYKKTLTNFMYSCNLKFRMIVFCNITPNFRTMVESFQAVMPDGLETIIVNNYQEAIENIITFKAGTYRHPEPESEAEHHEKAIKKHFLATIARISWFNMLDQHIALPSADDKYYTFIKAIEAMQADIREKEKEKNMELEHMKHDEEQKQTEMVVKLNAQIELNKKAAREHEKEIAALKTRIATQDMELTRVSTAIAEKTMSLRNLLDKIYALDIDTDVKRQMTDSCLSLIETETIEKRLNIELTESDSVFLSRLQKKHPHLNQRELRISLLVKLNYDTKEIARSVGISTRGMESIRYRMHKKLGLGKHQSIKTYLSDLAASF